MHGTGHGRWGNPEFLTGPRGFSTCMTAIRRARSLRIPQGRLNAGLLSTTGCVISQRQIKMSFNGLRLPSKAQK